jgi:TolB-like protein
VTDIFISYSHRDQARAALFAHSFEALGFKVWWDVGLRAGEAFDQAIEKAIRGAKAVVVLWSAQSVKSRWVRAEATLADRCRTLVPVMIGPCERPIIFELTHTAELEHWHGDLSDGAWSAFLADVTRMVAQEAPPATDVPAVPFAPPSVAETLKPGQSGSAPSLAVLPFTNRSGLPDDEVFAGGMVEDVISALSQGVNVRVLGAMATANLSRAVITDPAALGRQLGVQYLLEGNVRRVGENLRVTTQLLAAATGEVMSTAKFDRHLAELAELQEELVTDIAATLETQVFSLEMERALKKPGDITAWEAVARCISAYRKFNAAAHQNGIEQARRAVTIAPDYGPGHAVFAAANSTLYFHTSPDDPAEVARIRGLAERALALAPDDPMVLSYVGNALCQIGYLEEGQHHTWRAVCKVPGNGAMHFHHGQACLMLNQLEVGLSHFSTAARLMPGSHVIWGIKAWQSTGCYHLGRWPEAATEIDELISLNPTAPFAYITKALIVTKLGQNPLARKQVKTARSMGYGLTQAERLWRRASPCSPTLEADSAIIRDLYAATEPGA